MAVYTCPACGNKVDLNLPEGTQTFHCPLCGNNVTTDFIPAFSDVVPVPDYLDTALESCMAYAEELGDKYFEDH